MFKHKNKRQNGVDKQGTSYTIWTYKYPIKPRKNKGKPFIMLRIGKPALADEKPS